MVPANRVGRAAIVAAVNRRHADTAWIVVGVGRPSPVWHEPLETTDTSFRKVRGDVHPIIVDGEPVSHASGSVRIEADRDVAPPGGATIELEFRLARGVPDTRGIRLRAQRIPPVHASDPIRAGTDGGLTVD